MNKRFIPLLLLVLFSQILFGFGKTTIKGKVKANGAPVKDLKIKFIFNPDGQFTKFNHVVHSDSKGDFKFNIKNKKINWMANKEATAWAIYKDVLKNNERMIKEITFKKNRTNQVIINCEKPFEIANTQKKKEKGKEARKTKERLSSFSDTGQNQHQEPSNNKQSTNFSGASGSSAGICQYDDY